MAKTREKFSAALTWVIDKKNIVQKDFAEICGMSPASLGDYKVGRREGDEDTRVKIAKRLGYEYQAFLSLGEWILADKDPDEWQPVPGHFLDKTFLEMSDSERELAIKALEPQIRGFLERNGNKIQEFAKQWQLLDDGIKKYAQQLSSPLQKLDDEIKKFAKQFSPPTWGYINEIGKTFAGFVTDKGYQYQLPPTMRKIETQAILPNTVSDAPEGVPTSTIQHMGAHSPKIVISEGDALVDVYAVAGAGQGWELIEIDPIKSIHAPLSFVAQASFALLVRGDSMFPTLKNGSVVGIRRDEPFVNSEIYAVNPPEGGVSVKRVVRDYQRGGVILRSDNEDKNRYEDVFIPEAMTEGLLVGRVVWVWQGV